jgi:Transposase/Transposase IS116/IS110/IS902 family
MSKFSFYVGIDLGNTKQAICILDGDKAVVRRGVVEEHEVLGVIAEAIKDALPSAVAIAVEDRNNVIVEALLNGGFVVHSINPKQADRFREWLTAAGVKDDKRDASSLAQALWSHPEPFRVLEKRSDSDERLRTLNRVLEQLEDDHRRAANQLRASVLRFFPALLSLCQGADHPWFWALVLLLKDVEHSRRVRRSSIEALLKEHRKRNVTADDVAEVLNRPSLKPSRATSEAGLEQAGAHIQRLRMLKKQSDDFAAKRAALLKELAKPAADGAVSDAALILTMPGIGPQAASTLLAECGPLLRRGEHSLLRALAGVAPVTMSSGVSRRAAMRHACNPRLREALHHAAFAASVHDEKFKAQRVRLQAKGHTLPRALRTIADKMLAILIAMLRDRTPYGSKAASTAPTSAA